MAATRDLNLTPKEQLSEDLSGVMGWEVTQQQMITELNSKIPSTAVQTARVGGATFKKVVAEEDDSQN